MKLKIKFENIFVVLSILFIFGCCVYYGNRLVKYYKVFNPKTETGEKVVLFSAIVRQNNPVITEGDGLYIHNGDFYFKGENVNNYVIYADKKWRIMEVTRSGLVKMVLDDSLGNIMYDNKNATDIETTYEKSYIHNYIKDENNLKLNPNGLELMEICLDLIDESNNIKCENKTTDYVYLLGISDYADTINTTTTKSYINNLENIWLNNKNSEGFAWTLSKGMLTQDALHFEYAVKPVITLKSTAVNSTGDGTENNPYIVKDGE